MKATDRNIVLSAPAVLPDGTPCPEVLTPVEAAKFLRIADNPRWQNTLRYYRERGKLKATRIGKRIFYTRKSLVDFLEKATE